MPADQDQADSAAPGPETGTPPEPSGTPAAGSSPGFAWLQVVLSAIIGAVIALALAFVLVAQGLAPGLEDPRAETALQATESLQAGLDTLSADVAALTSAAEDDDVDARVAGLAQRTGELEDRLSDLTASLESMAADLGPLAADDAPDPYALSDRLDELAERMDGLAVAASRAGDQGDATDPAPLSAPRPANRVVGDLAAAAEAGEPFRSQLALLAAFGIPEDIRESLDPYADGSTPTREALIAAYDEVEQAILSADREARRGDGFFSRLFGSASDIVSVRPTEPIEGDSTMAVVSRLNAWMEDGDLSAALSERRSLPPEAQAASADWAGAVADRLALDAAVKNLTAATTPAGDG